MEGILKENHQHWEDVESETTQLPKPNITMPTDLSKFKKGTTTISMLFKEGIVVAVDSRATRGAFIAASTVQKYIPVTSNIIGTIAGTASDCQYWMRVLSKECKLYELKNNCKISVAAASKILASLLYQYRDMDLGVYSMLCGYDSTGPHIYSIEAGGARVAGNMFSLGSGSNFAISIADTEYDYYMPKEKAIELGRKAVMHATHRDAGSGGTINVVFIDENGWQLISSDDCNDLYNDLVLNQKGEVRMEED